MQEPVSILNAVLKMKYQNISPFYKPIDERKRLTSGQFRFMRIVAVIIFVVLLFISFRSDARTAEIDMGNIPVTTWGIPAPGQPAHARNEAVLLNNEV